ncbi:TRAFAC clade GTPase domain-containing protein [Streptomyces galilaeus]
MTVLKFLLLGYLFYGGAIASAVILYAFPAALSRALITIGVHLGPWRAGAADSRIRPPVAEESAHLSHWAGQVWTDTGTAVALGAAELNALLFTEWLGGDVRNLLHGRRPSHTRGQNAFTRTLLVLTGPGYAAGALAGTAAAVAYLLLVLSWFGLLLALVRGALGALALALRGLERARLLARGVRMQCPYPGCYGAVPLPVHRCPGCNEAHRSLHPGRFGVFVHVCVCGRRLSAALPGHRPREATECPHCARALPASLGTARLVHIPIVGGTSSGKTMLMAAMLAGITSWEREGRLTVTCALPEDRRRLQLLKSQVDSGGWVHGTPGRQPQAYMLEFTSGRSRRLLYLYDPHGGVFDNAATVRSQHYLAHADGIVFVTDVLAAPEVRRVIDGADAPCAVDARPSPEGPRQTYDHLVGEFGAMSGRRGRTPCAVVVTKRDALDRLHSIPRPLGPLDQWLTEVSLGDLVLGLRHNFGKVRYWAVSAAAATGAGAPESEGRHAAQALLWLLGTTGLPVKSLLRDVGPRP